jgi:hypothetical protein
MAILASAVVGIISGLIAAQLGASPLACWTAGGTACVAVATIAVAVIGLLAA